MSGLAITIVAQPKACSHQYLSAPSLHTIGDKLVEDFDLTFLAFVKVRPVKYT